MAINGIWLLGNRPRHFRVPASLSIPLREAHLRLTHAFSVNCTPPSNPRLTFCFEILGG